MINLQTGMRTGKDRIPPRSFKEALSSPAEPTLAQMIRARDFSQPVVVMAPMAGVTDRSYRAIAREFGAQMTYSEMLSMAAVSYRSQKTWDLVNPHETESTFAVQIFGHDPDEMTRGAVMIAEYLGDRLELIDVNMACPVRKIIKNGDGSALMKEPDQAASIIRSLKAALDVPVTAKMRIGLSDNNLCGVEFAQVLEHAGVDMLAVHGRTVAQMYSGLSSTERIAEVARAVSVPVLGSGDIYTAEHAVDLIKACDLAGVMVARGSYGNPWIFSQIRCAFTGEEPQAYPSVYDRLNVVRRHIALHADEGAHIPRFRKILGWYVKGFPVASEWRQKAMRSNTREEFLAAIDHIESYLQALEAEKGELVFDPESYSYTPAHTPVPASAVNLD